MLIVKVTVFALDGTVVAGYHDVSEMGDISIGLAGVPIGGKIQMEFFDAVPEGVELDAPLAVAPEEPVADAGTDDNFFAGTSFAEGETSEEDGNV